MPEFNDEIVKEVKSVRVDYQCPMCKEGLMRPTGRIYMTNPVQYSHLCNNIDCNHHMALRKSYPCIEYKEI